MNGADLRLTGDLTESNGMYIVKDGTITFTDTTPTDRQTVNGIFVAAGDTVFTADTIRNNDLDTAWTTEG